MDAVFWKNWQNSTLFNIGGTKPHSTKALGLIHMSFLKWQDVKPRSCFYIALNMIFKLGYYGLKCFKGNTFNKASNRSFAADKWVSSGCSAKYFSNILTIWPLVNPDGGGLMK